MGAPFGIIRDPPRQPRRMKAQAQRIDRTVQQQGLDAAE
jgi:hypothetical protein